MLSPVSKKLSIHTGGYGFEYCMVEMQFVLSVVVLGLENPLLCKVKLTLSVLLVIFKLLNQLLSLQIINNIY